MEHLKACLDSFRKVDDELKQHNEKAADLRRERKDVEDKLAEILAKPEYAGLEKLESSVDGSILKICRPGWKKGWSMSKKELLDGLNDYFWLIKNTTPEKGWEPTAEECFEIMVEKQEKKVSNEFAFERVAGKPKKMKV